MNVGESLIREVCLPLFMNSKDVENTTIKDVVERCIAPYVELIE